jgi:putative ABC transport system permease protein
MIFFDKDMWQEIWASLMHNKLRTFLTAFGVFWGIFMLLAMIGASSGLSNGIKRGWEDFAFNSFFMNTRQTTMPYGGYDRGRWFNFRNEDIQQLKYSFPEISVISGGVWYNGTSESGNIVVYGKETGSFPVIGDSPDRFRVAPLDIYSGRRINWDDFSGKRKVAMIGREVAMSLFKQGEEPVGKMLRINDIYFLIIGVFKSKQPGSGADWENRQIFMPSTTAQQAFNLGDRISWLTINARDDISASDIIAPIRLFLSKKYKVHPDDEIAFRINDISMHYRQTSNLFAGISFLTWTIGAFTLIAGVIGIGNIMLITVKERTKEIGVRRAVGAKPFQIVSQIMLESALLTVVSGYAGMLLGLAAVGGMGYLPQGDAPFYNPQVNFGAAMLALAMLAGSGLAAGIMPALAALRIKPIEALRD